jgi:hypothetical protein
VAKQLLGITEPSIIDQDGNPVTLYPCCDHCEGCLPHEWHTDPCEEGCNDA